MLDLISLDFNALRKTQCKRRKIAIVDYWHQHIPVFYNVTLFIRRQRSKVVPEGVAYSRTILWYIICSALTNQKSHYAQIK